MKQREYIKGQVGFESVDGVGAGPLPGFVEGRSNGARDVLGAGLGALEKLNELAAREYVETRNGEVDDLVLDVSDQFERWKAAYNRENQGRFGINALADYNAKFEELARAAGEKLGAADYEVFSGRLRRKLQERQLFAIRDGSAFESRQRELWLTSQASAQEAELNSYAAVNPHDDEGIAFKRQQLVEKLGELHPGQDLGALLVKMDNRTLASRMQALQLEEDYEGMERLLSARSRLQKAGLTEKSALGAWCAAHNNPGCVKTDERNMAMFATGAEGIAAIMERARSYASRGKDTIAKIMHMYAPESENDTKAYIDFISKQTGKGPNEKLDTDDPVFLKAFARAIGRYENSLAISDEEAEEGLKYLREHGKPKPVGRIPVSPNGRRALLANGIGPDEIRNWEKVIEAGKQQYNFRVLQGKATELWKGLQGLPPERRAQAFYDATKDMDMAERRKLSEIIGPEITASEQYAKRELEERQENALPEVLAADKRDAPSLIEGLVEDLPAPQKMSMRNYLLAARREHDNALNMQWNISWQRMLDQELAGVADASDVAQDASLRGFVTAMAKDSADADAMLEYGKRFLERQNKALEAKDRNIIEEIDKQGADPEAKRALLQGAIARGSLSQKGAARAMDLLFGPASEESRENAEALMRAKQLVSNGALTTEAAKREYAKAHRLTLGQEKDLLSFAGYGANSTWNRVQSTAKSLGYNNLKPEEIDWICSKLPLDHEPTDRDIREITRLALTKDPGILFHTSLVEEVVNNPALDDWLPDIEDHEEDFYRNTLKTMNVPVNNRNLQIAKKMRLAKQFGFAVKDEFIK